MMMKRFLAIALSICMLLSMTPVAPARATESEDLEFEVLEGSVKTDLLKPLETEDLALELDIDEDEMVKVLVVMDEESVLEKNPQGLSMPGFQQQKDAMEYQQQVVIELIQEDVLDGEKLEISYQYTVLDNAFATMVPYGSIKEIEELDGVARVVIQQVYEVCENENVIADPNTAADGMMIGRESTWANGYTGKGMKIAIIDTGLDIDHQNFAPLSEDKLTDTSADSSTIAAVLENLNASARFSGLTAAQTYYNTKVVFGFNYCDSDLDITHDNDAKGDHGTHVAGIAAANKVSGSDVVGVAPDAQLYIMKVFGKNGGAYTEDILAALEDALMLGADVVNMSLGSPAGFTTSGDEYLDGVYANVSKTGTVLSVSAGNNYTSGYANTWGTDMNLTAYPDNGVGGAPGTYANTMTVASVENWKIMRAYIDAEGYQIGYIDSGDSPEYGLPTITTLTGEYEFVYVPGTGAPEDYEGLDVAGKIALVQRGGLSFLEKHTYAEAQGAVATLIFNNTTGEFGMDMTGTKCATPAAAITMADGAYLVSNPGLKLTFPTDQAYLPSPLAYQMSDFSSQGPAPDLTLSPDIAAPGGNIYSTVNNGQYGLMSGTSMAAPNIAGMTALVMQYVKETFPAGTDYRAVTQYLLMSTAVPLDYSEGLTYSPRVQGAGLGNAFNAVTTNAYLTVEGNDYVKADLGDDNNRTGVYDFAFNVHNFSEINAFYRLATNVQTEGVAAGGGYYFMAGVPMDLGSATEETSDAMVLTHDVDNDGDTDSHDAYHIYQAAKGNALNADWEGESFRYDVNTDETVAEADVQAYLDALVGKTSEADLEDTVLMVKPGETAVVNVNVTLGAPEKGFLDAYFPNGGYVEGFTTLTAEHNNGVDLSLPYLAFYGDWAESPVLDEADYIDYINDGVMGNQFPYHALFTQFDGDEAGTVPGMNPYVEELIDPAHISLSPNGDGYMDSITDIYLSLMRSAAYLELRMTNVQTGEMLYQFGGNNASKTVFNQSYGQIVPFIASWYNLPALPDLEDQENNTELVFEAEVLAVDPDAQPEVWQIPITIDLEAPELLGAQRTVDASGKVILTLTFRDNVSAAAIILADSTGTEALAINGVADTEPDENGYQNYSMSYNITGLTGKLMVILSDYAVNESYYGINLGGEGTPYGDLVAYQYNFLSGTNGWASFSEGVNYNETTIFTNYEMDFVAAEYVNGFVYAQTEDGSLYGFKYTDMLNNTMTLEDVFITQLENVYQDLAYNYFDGKLYGLLTFEEEWQGEPSVTTEVYSINLKGAYYDEEMWMDVAPYQEDWVQSRGELYGLCLAIDDAGAFYILGNHHENVYDEETWDYIGTEVSTAQLWKAEMEESWGYVSLGAFQKVGDTGLTMDYLQSMTWNHNTEELIWARFAVEGYSPVMELRKIDPVTVETTKVGTLSGETCGLFVPLTAEAAAKPEHANVPAMDANAPAAPILRNKTVTMNIGGTQVLTYDVDPWFSAVKDMVWSSSDESIVTVDQNGKITAVGAGSATITVANKADETRLDTCAVEVTALDLKLEGVISTMGSGIGNAHSARLYELSMVDGVAAMTDKATITAPAELNYGLSLATSEYARGSVWACEYGNTGMIYEIDPATGVAKNVFEPIDGDMMFGMHYSEALDSFTNIMNFYLYVDVPMNEEMYGEMEDSYDEEQGSFMWHRINMLPYLQEAGNGFVTGETGQGASSEVVFCAITGIDGGIKDAYGETYYMDTYRDYTGNYDMTGSSLNYQPDQTLILLDNVGRLWYINEVTGLSREADEFGNVLLTRADGIEIMNCGRAGVVEVKTGADTYSMFHITQIVETPLTNMFREGTMPRFTYHFSDIEFAGYTAEGDPMIVMSLYDYWNNGTTNELYLYVPGHETDEMDYETWEPIRTPDRMFNLGNTGNLNFIASIHSAQVTGGVDPEEETPVETNVVNKLTAGLYKAN